MKDNFISIRVPHSRKLNESKTKAHFYNGNGYAGINSKNLVAYYGFECLAEDGDWCFEAKFDGKVINIPFSKLGHTNAYDCMACLLKGISWVMEKYKLSL